MTLRARLTSLALAYFVVFAVGVGASFVAVRSWARALDARRDLLTQITDVTRLRLALSDEETGVRGYAITGLDAYLGPYRSDVASEVALLGSLERFSARSASLARDVAATRAAIDDWHRSAAEPAVSSRTAPDAARSAAIATTGVGKPLLDVVRARLDAFEADLSSSSARADRDAHRGLRRAVGALVLTGAALGALTVWTSMSLRRWVITPLHAMAERARLIKSGQSAQMTVDAAPEFRELASAVEEMQSTIATQRDVALRAREALEQNALLAVHVRRELETSLGEYPTGWTVAAGLRCAEGLVAGDCYEISLVGPSTIGIVVIDIAGHGAPNAIAAMKSKELLRVALREGRLPGDALTWLYEQRLVENGFLTAFVGLISTNSGLCRYANAGHPPPKLVTPDGLVDLLPTGPLLGPVEGHWTTASVDFHEGDKLAVYTDGIIEARDAERGFYGEDRLTAILRATTCEDAETVTKAILDDLTTFSGQLRLTDDATLVVVCHSAD